MAKRPARRAVSKPCPRCYHPLTEQGICAACAKRHPAVKPEPPRDTNQLAHLIVSEATAETPTAWPGPTRVEAWEVFDRPRRPLLAPPPPPTSPDLSEEQEEAIITAYLGRVGEAKIEEISEHLETERIRHCLEYLAHGAIIDRRWDGEWYYRMPPIMAKLVSEEYHRGWTAEELVEAIQRYVLRHHVVPASADWQRTPTCGRPEERRRRDAEDGIRWPSSALVNRHFPSWGAALEAAGIAMVGRGRRSAAAHAAALAHVRHVTERSA